MPTTYPALAARLLEQGDDVFTGERREVSVMFVDIRDFTPFAEANTAEDTVARLNALFDRTNAVYARNSSRDRRRSMRILKIGLRLLTRASGRGRK